MFLRKSTVINIILFFLCLISCLMLFNLKSEQFSIQIPSIKKHVSLYNNSPILFNLNFKYLINNHVCEQDEDILGVIIVTSYYGNIETRSAMRRTISNEELKNFKLRRVFLLGVGPADNKYEISIKSLLHENERFHDIVQGNFLEAYRNLTYKHIMGLQWASHNCKHAKYVIKMDDDIVFNVNNIIKIVNELKIPENSIAGYILRGMVAIREPANKWYVTKTEYEESTYPDFVSGWFYITTPKTASDLVLESQTVPYFWIDDVYVTGILAKQMNIKHHNLNKLFAVHAEYLQCCVTDVKLHNYDCQFLIGPNGGDNNFFYTFNKVMLKCQRKYCKKRPEGKELKKTCVAERKTHVGRGRGLIETIHLF